MGEEVAYPRMRIMHVSHSAYHGVSHSRITRITAYHATYHTPRIMEYHNSRITRITHFAHVTYHKRICAYREWVRKGVVSQAYHARIMICVSRVLWRDTDEVCIMQYHACIINLFVIRS